MVFPESARSGRSLTTQSYDSISDVSMPVPESYIQEAAQVATIEYPIQIGLLEPLDQLLDLSRIRGRDVVEFVHGRLKAPILRRERQFAKTPMRFFSLYTILPQGHNLTALTINGSLKSQAAGSIKARRPSSPISSVVKSGGRESSNAP
jgi:hypothetical protein